MNKKEAEKVLSELIATVKDSRFFIHHIWPIQDSEESIRESVFDFGLKVKDKKSMYSTVKPLDNISASEVLEYYFNTKFNNRTNILMAIPKEIEVYGKRIPFSTDVLPYDGEKTMRMNECYLSPFDVARGKNVSQYIPKEFVLCSVSVSDEDYIVKPNETFNPYEKVEDYKQPIVTTFGLEESDEYSIISSKIDGVLEQVNEDVGHRDYSGTIDDDFDF